MNKNQRVNNVLKILDEQFSNPKSELNFNNSYELVVSVALSAQCTDKKVNEVTSILFKRYGTFNSLALASVVSIEKIIRPINYYKTKAKNIVNLAKMVLQEFKGNLPKTHSELISLPGVGNKTANVVLSELGLEATFPVDTHVFRVSKRLGLSKGKNVKEVEEYLKSNFKQTLWRNMHHQLILHGRKTCKAQNPLCNKCTLKNYCPSAHLES